MKIYCFGNEFWQKDDMVKKIVDKINVEGVSFVKCNDPEEIEGEKEVVILDVVKGIDNVIVIEKIDDLKNLVGVGCHDLDLGFWLKLRREIGDIDKVIVIGVPSEGDEEKIKKDVRRIVNRIKR